MYVYILLVLLIIINAILFQKNNKKIYSIIICVLLTLVAGLRDYSIGNDTVSYLGFFNNVLYNYQTSRFERGFVYLMLFIKKIFNNYTVFLLASSIFFNSAICKLIRKESPNMLISFLIFFLGRFFFSEMNIMRQFIAIGIIIVGFKYIYNRNFIKYLLCVILASLFHKSALINIILYFIFDIKITKKIGAILTLCSLTMFLFFQKVINYIVLKFNIYEEYVDVYLNSNKLGSLLNFLICFMIIIYVLFIIKKEKKKSKKENFYLWLLILSTISSFLSIRMSVLSRIQNYFDIFIIIIIPLFTEKIKNKIIVYLIIIIFYILYFILILYYRPEWNYVYPYKFVS